MDLCGNGESCDEDTLHPECSEEGLQVPGQTEGHLRAGRQPLSGPERSIRRTQAEIQCNTSSQREGFHVCWRKAQEFEKACNA